MKKVGESSKFAFIFPKFANLTIIDLGMGTPCNSHKLPLEWKYLMDKYKIL